MRSALVRGTTRPDTGMGRLGLGTSLATTPGRLRAISVVLVLLIGAVWAASFFTVERRQHGIQTITVEARAAVVSSQKLETQLSEAEASLANSFLAIGQAPGSRNSTETSPLQQYAFYRSAVQQAMEQVGTAARENPLPPTSSAATSTSTTPSAIQRCLDGQPAGSPIQTLADYLPIYIGLVETARANYLQGYPVGVAVLNQATQCLDTTLLPAATMLYQQSLRRLSGGFGSASSSEVPLDVIAVLLVASLMVAQVLLARRTHRILSLALSAGSLVAIVLVAWTLLSLTWEGQAISQSQNRSTLTTEVAQVQEVVYRINSDESLALLSRGSGVCQDMDFELEANQVGAPLRLFLQEETELEVVPQGTTPVPQVGTLQGITITENNNGCSAAGGNLASQPLLVGNISRSWTPQEAADLRLAQQAFGAYLSMRAQIQEDDTTAVGAHKAFGLASSSGPGSYADEFGRTTDALQGAEQLTAAQFSDKTASAKRHLDGFPIGLSVGFLLAAALVLFGFQQRIDEYHHP